jgi:cytoskeleton protein RodZ
LARLEAGRSFPEVTSVPNATTNIGETLRSAREALGASVEEAAWRTRIRPEYLRALEDERFDACGHLAHARAHLHSYARFLGLDANALVRDYSEQIEHAEPSSIDKLHERVKEEKSPPKPNWLIAAVVAAIVLIAASLTGIVRGPGPHVRAAAESLPSLPALTQPSPTTAAVVPAAPAHAVTVVVVAHGRSWVRVLADDTLVFEGVLAPGASKTFTANEAVDLTVGNAGMVRVILNGRDLGPPGKAGQVYHARLGPRGPLPAK